jgi:hypothetical protein
MATVYEYWQHRETGAVWAVKLVDGRLVGAIDLYQRDVDQELLTYLPYRAIEARSIDKQREKFRRIDGQRRAA